MNKEETKTKLIKFCKGLHKEGLINNEELKHCHTSFDNMNPNTLQNITKLPIINDNLQNFGMSIDQSINQDKLIIGNNKKIQCRLLSNQNKRNKDGSSSKVKMTLYSTMETSKSANNLFIKHLEGENLINNNDNSIIQNITFELEKNNQGLYTIKNLFSNEYIKVNMDKSVITEGNNKTNNSLFKIINHNNLYKFESHVFPGYYLNAQNPIKVTEGNINTQNWEIEIIKNDENLNDNNDDNVAFNAGYTRQLISNYLDTFELNRFDYILMNAKLKFIDLLKKKTILVIANNGLILEYLRERVKNNEIDLTKSQLMKIAANLKNEIINNEIVMLDDQKEIIQNKSSQLINDMNSNTNTLFEINNLIDTAIEEKNIQLATLNQLLNKVNSETKYLNHQDKNFTEILNHKLDISFRSTHNNKIIEQLWNQNNINFWLYIFLFIGLSLIIIFLTYKLLNKIKKEF